MKPTRRPFLTPALTATACRALRGLLPALVLAGPAGAEPLITEFLASNTNGLTDDDGDFSDWIEIHNPDAEPVNLEGYYLTDDEGNPSKWEIPPAVISPGSYLVIFASNKDRSSFLGEKHTNFRLGREGEYLALVDRDGETVIQEWAPGYPPQEANFSYGLVSPEPGAESAFLASPTPGAANSARSNRSTAVVQFSHPGGYFTGVINLELTTDVPGASIRYTTTGARPSILTATAYTGPIRIDSPTRIRAAAAEPGKSDGPLCEATYYPMANGLLGVTSNLPIIVLDTDGGGTPSENTYRESLWAIYEPGPNGRTSLADPPALVTRGGIRRRGSSTSGNAKYSLRMEAWGEDNEADKDISPFGMPEEADWVLSGRFSFDRALMRNPFIYAISNQMGRYAVRTQFVEVYINTNGGAVDTNDYFGVYAFMENIKRGRDRVDVDQLQPSENTGDAVTGGYMVKIDRADPGDSGFSAGGQTLRYVEPKEDEITTAQRNYIRDYINDFRNRLSNPDPVTGWRSRIDSGAWIDEHILRLLTKDPDGLRLSTYFRKDRGGKFNYGPIWDFDRTMGCDSDSRALTPTGWNPSSGVDYFTYPWWNELLGSGARSGGRARDQDFWIEWQDRWFEIRRGPLSEENMAAVIDGMADQIRESQVRNFNRWSQNRPNGGQFSTAGGGWEGEVSHLKGWLNTRVDWIDDQFLQPVNFSPPAGEVDEDTPLRLSSRDATILNPATIYYTTDGSDPRLPGGEPSPSAVDGTTLTLTEPVTVRARVLRTGVWSAINAATYLVGVEASSAQNLAVTEVMYNPSPPTEEEAAAGFLDPGAFEFIELLNVGDKPVDLSNLRVVDGVDLPAETAGTGAAILLQAGAYGLLVADRRAFDARYGAGLPVLGEFSGGRLNDAGERVELAFDQSGVGPGIAFTYNDRAPWPEVADGLGFSLVALASAAGANLDEPTNWRASSAPGGSPGAADPPPQSEPAILVNEILANSGAGAGDRVELYNPTGAAVDISGWFLTDDAREPKKYRLPEGTTIAPGGYLVVEESEFNPTPETPAPGHFALDSDGEEVALFSAAAAAGGDDTTLTGYSHRFPFDASDEGVSIGRVETSDGERSAAQRAPTFGAPNAGPAVGPVVISELHYHPAGEGTSDEEFVEIYNLSGAPVNLFAGEPATGWRLGGVDFDFPADFTLGAREVIIVSKAEPDAFRQARGVPPATRVIGPYPGSLSNGGERVELRRPGAADTTLIPVDSVRYNDRAPWPTEPDGAGPALERVDPSAFADEPLNWRATAEAGGNPGTVPVVDDPLGDWRAEVFTEAERNDPAVSGDGADPDGDGLANLLEFAFGADPKAGGSAPVQPPALIAGAGGAEHLSITFTRRADTGGVRVAVEVSGDLSSWFPALLEGAPQDNGDGTETVTYRDPDAADAGARRFIRVAVD